MTDWLHNTSLNMFIINLYTRHLLLSIVVDTLRSDAFMCFGQPGQSNFVEASLIWYMQEAFVS